MGRQRVDSFHRERNKESLNTYLSKIKKERGLRREHKRRIREHERNLEELSRTVEVKRQYLAELQGEIFKYRSDLRPVLPAPPRTRKYTESSKSESRLLPAEFSPVLERKHPGSLQA